MEGGRIRSLMLLLGIGFALAAPVTGAAPRLLPPLFPAASWERVVDGVEPPLATARVTARAGLASDYQRFALQRRFGANRYTIGYVDHADQWTSAGTALAAETLSAGIDNSWRVPGGDEALLLPTIAFNASQVRVEEPEITDADDAAEVLAGRVAINLGWRRMLGTTLLQPALGASLTQRRLNRLDEQADALLLPRELREEGLSLSAGISALLPRGVSAFLRAESYEASMFDAQSVELAAGLRRSF